MKNISILLFISVTFFSCKNTNPTKTSSEFNYEGNEVMFMTTDTLITDATIKRIKNHAISEARRNWKHPESFIPNNLIIARVDSVNIEGLKEFIKGDITFNAYIYFNSKNSFGMDGREKFTFYFSESGEYLGKLPEVDID